MERLRGSHSWLSGYWAAAREWIRRRTSRQLAPALGASVQWLSPLVVAPLSVLVTFQFGNVQLACIAGALLVQTAGSIAPAVAALRLAPAGVSAPAASAAGR